MTIIWHKKIKIWRLKYKLATPCFINVTLSLTLTRFYSRNSAGQNICSLREEQAEDVKNGIMVQLMICVWQQMKGVAWLGHAGSTNEMKNLCEIWSEGLNGGDYLRDQNVSEGKY
jgi:hypothetical protein